LLGNNCGIRNYTTAVTSYRPSRVIEKYVFCAVRGKVLKERYSTRTNAELVPKFHVALHASHAALPMVTLKISPCINVTLTLGWTTLFMGDMGEGILHREDEVTVKRRN
jgi:hypothetical protein